jgi:Fur family ferric uptake transcriptional regulator
MSCFVTLKEKGLRLTRPRQLILDYIHERGDHLTAEEILNYVHEKSPRVNKSTVYRTLELLEKNGCVFTSRANDRTLYHHTEHKHHYHLLCQRCGKIIECQEDLFTPVEQSLASQYGFSPDLDHMVINGVCESCRHKEMRRA